MSDPKIHDATLPGFTTGPLFPESLMRLHELVKGKTTIFRNDIYEAASRLEGFDVFSVNVRTTDGHRWYAGYAFNYGNNKWYVLLPFAQGSEAPDGPMVERYSALYIEGGIEESHIDQLLQEFYAAIVQVHKEKCEAIARQALARISAPY